MSVKDKILAIVKNAIESAEIDLIEKAIYKDIDINETCDVPQPITTINIYNSSIGTVLHVNGKLCDDLDKY